MATQLFSDHPSSRSAGRRTTRALVVMAAVLVAVPLTMGSGAAATGQPTPAPSSAAPAGAPSAPIPSTADPLPSVTAQGRASDRIAPATVFVQVDWKARVYVDGVGWWPEPLQWSDGCTGVVVDSDGFIVTAGHCVDYGWDEGGAQRTAVKYLIQNLVDTNVLTEARGTEIFADVVTGNSRWLVEGSLNSSTPDYTIHVTTGGGRAPWNSNPTAPPTGYEANVVGFKPWSQGDVALLKIDAKNLPVAVLAPPEDVKIGQDLLAVGYPLDLAQGQNSTASLALTNREGTLEATDTQGQHGPGNRFYAMSASLTGGMSGGPAINLLGQVIGISSTSIGGETYFVVPSAVVLEQWGGQIQNTPGHVDELYLKGLDYYYDGHYSDAIGNFEQVLLLAPDLASVVEKKTDAAQRREEFGDRPKVDAPAPEQPSSTLPWLAIGGGIAVILAGLTLLGLVRRRRRRRGSDDAPLAGPVLLPNPQDASSADPALADAHRTGEHDAAEATSYRAAAPVMTISAGRFCRSCGTGHGPGDAFCSQCGTSLRRTV